MLSFLASICYLHLNFIQQTLGTYLYTYGRPAGNKVSNYLVVGNFIIVGIIMLQILVVLVIDVHFALSANFGVFFFANFTHNSCVVLYIASWVYQRTNIKVVVDEINLQKKCIAPARILLPCLRFVMQSSYSHKPWLWSQLSPPLGFSICDSLFYDERHFFRHKGPITRGYINWNR